MRAGGHTSPRSLGKVYGVRASGRTISRSRGGVYGVRTSGQAQLLFCISFTSIRLLQVKILNFIGKQYIAKFFRYFDSLI